MAKKTQSSKTVIPPVAVVGGGYWGKNLVRNFYNLNALKMVSDKSEAILSSLKDQFKGLDTCLALTDVLARDEIEGVVIATPAETHFNIARESLLAGKHVYVEKPLVLREEEGHELIDIAQKNSRVLMVGHLLQYHPVFVRLKEMAQAGELPAGPIFADTSVIPWRLDRACVWSPFDAAVEAEIRRLVPAMETAAYLHIADEKYGMWP